MHAWLRATLAELGAEAGLDADTLSLSDDEARLLLAVARIASHDSGDRTNAPLLCFLIGRMLERSSLAIEDAHRVVTARAREATGAD